MDTYRLLPEAWPADRRRTIRRSLIIFAVFAVIGIGLFILILVRIPPENMAAAIIIATISAVIMTFAIGGGLALGVFMRKSIFLGGKIELDANEVRWKEIGNRAKVKLADIQNVAANPEDQSIRVTRKNGKRVMLPGPIENQADLIQKLQARAPAQSL